MNQQQGKPQIAYIPCDENDPDLAGGFTSTDGQSLCYVKEIELPSIPTEEQKEEAEKCCELAEQVIKLMDVPKNKASSNNYQFKAWQEFYGRWQQSLSSLRKPVSSAPPISHKEDEKLK